MNEIKVSVIIPVYNSEPFLRECLDSICNQTLNDIEIICVDDGSTDESFNILKDYEKKDRRITIMKHSGKGPADARNAGFDVSKGKYICFLDSDDFFDLQLLEKAYNRITKMQADIVLYDVLRFNNITGEYMPADRILNLKVFPKKDVFSKYDVPNTIFQLKTGVAWNMMLSRSFIIKYDLSFPSMFFAEDMVFSYSALILAEKITTVPEKLIYYRVNNSESLKSKKAKYPESAVEVCLYLKKLLDEKDFFDLLKISYYNHVAYFIEEYLSTLNSYSAFTHLFDLLKSKYLKELGLDKCKKEMFFVEDYYEWYNDIKELSREEYLYKQTLCKKTLFEQYFSIEKS